MHKKLSHSLERPIPKSLIDNDLLQQYFDNFEVQQSPYQNFVQPVEKNEMWVDKVSQVDLIPLKKLTGSKKKTSVEFGKSQTLISKTAIKRIQSKD